MMKNVTFKIALSLIVIGVSVYYFFPPKDSQGKDKIKLGLDLKGGMHLELEVKTDKVVLSEVKHSADRIRNLLRDKAVVADSVSAKGKQIAVEGVSSEQQEAVRNLFKEYFFTDEFNVSSRIAAGKTRYELTLKGEKEEEIVKKTLDAAYDTLQRRVNTYGLEDNTMQQSSGQANHISVDLPGVETPEDVKELLKKTASLELKLVHPSAPFGVPQDDILKALNGRIPDGFETVMYAERSGGQESKGYILVNSAPVITGRHLTDAEASSSQSMESPGAAVNFRLNSEGASRFGEATGANVGRRLAIILDNQAISAPTIQSKINESGVITSIRTMEEAKVLATALKSGALPADIVILAESTVGPSLGLKSIMEGVYAGLLGLTLIVLFMVVYYKLSGANAILCLIVNVVLLLGFLGGFHASLTLPGIAGIILTIGMGVDTNVLQFERIREELRLGKTVAASVEAGFSKAFVTIIDTHLASIISGIILYQFGTIQVKGFAVTLIAGLVANLFSSVFVCRTLFQMVINQRRVKNLSI